MAVVEEAARRYLEVLLQRYTAYHDHKENAAWAGAALYATAFTTALVSSAWPPSGWPPWALYLGPVVMATFVLTHTWWQLGRRRIAAVRVAGVEALLAQWLTRAPSREELQLPPDKQVRASWRQRFWQWLRPVGDLTDKDYPQALVQAWQGRRTRAQFHEWLLMAGGVVLLAAVLVKTSYSTHARWAAPVLLASQAESTAFALAAPDVVAIAGIVGTLVGTVVGALVGALVTWKVQQRQFAHEDRTRFHDIRLAVYAEFNDACDKVTAAAHAGAQAPHDLARVARSYETLRLVASERVWAPAREVQATITKLASAPASDFAALERELTSQQRELSYAIRRELGVE